MGGCETPRKRPDGSSRCATWRGDICPIAFSDEIRERKGAAQAAYEEAQQLEAALAALDWEARGGAGQRRLKERRSGRRSTARPASARARRGANREAILAFVSERPGVTAREIADATGIARTTVASTVTRLAADGVLERSELTAGGVGFRVPVAGSAD